MGFLSMFFSSPQACQLLAVAATVDHVMVKAALEACAQAVQWQQALHLWLGAVCSKDAGYIYIYTVYIIV